MLMDVLKVIPAEVEGGSILQNNDGDARWALADYYGDNSNNHIVNKVFEGVRF